MDLAGIESQACSSARASEIASLLPYTVTIAGLAGPPGEDEDIRRIPTGHCESLSLERRRTLADRSKGVRCASLSGRTRRQAGDPG